MEGVPGISTVSFTKYMQKGKRKMKRIKKKIFDAMHIPEDYVSLIIINKVFASKTPPFLPPIFHCLAKAFAMPLTISKLNRKKR